MVLKKCICQTNVISKTYKYFQNKRDCTTDSKTSHPDINTDGPAWQWISWRSSCSRNATAWSDTGRRLTSAVISTFMTCIPKFSIDCTNIFDWTIIESYSLNKKSLIYILYILKQNWETKILVQHEHLPVSQWWLGAATVSSCWRDPHSKALQPQWTSSPI